MACLISKLIKAILPFVAANICRLNNWSLSGGTNVTGEFSRIFFWYCSKNFWTVPFWFGEYWRFLNLKLRGNLRASWVSSLIILSNSGKPTKQNVIPVLFTKFLIQDATFWFNLFEVLVKSTKWWNSSRITNLVWQFSIHWHNLFVNCRVSPIVGVGSLWYVLN